MTDQQHFIAPPHEVYKWWEEACKRPPSSFYEKLDHVAARAAAWGWQQRAARVPGELQEARDEELQACCEWIADNSLHHAESDLLNDLRTARRPKPPSLAEEALDQLSSIQIDLTRCGMGISVETIRAALERLQELEGQSDD